MYQSWTWLQAILWTVVCSQDFCLSAGYLLAIGWLWPQINTHQDIDIYYYLPKLHMAASNTLDCSVFTRFWAICWLWPKINTLQDIVIYYYVPKLNMATSNTLDWGVFTRFLAHCWLSPQINALQDIVIYYYVPTLHMAADFWLSAGYQLAIGR